MKDLAAIEAEIDKLAIENQRLNLQLQRTQQAYNELAVKHDKLLRLVQLSEISVHYSFVP